VHAASTADWAGAAGEILKSETQGVVYVDMQIINFLWYNFFKVTTLYSGGIRSQDPYPVSLVAGGDDTSRARYNIFVLHN
jgi:hypothetical protein